MTRAEMEAEASRQRSELHALERKLQRFKLADRIRDTSVVIGINNTTISGQGWATTADQELVKRVRELIAAAVEGSDA